MPILVVAGLAVWAGLASSNLVVGLPIPEAATEVHRNQSDGVGAGNVRFRIKAKPSTKAPAEEFYTTYLVSTGWVRCHTATEGWGMVIDATKASRPWVYGRSSIWIDERRQKMLMIGASVELPPHTELAAVPELEQSVTVIVINSSWDVDFWIKEHKLSCGAKSSPAK